MLPGFRTPFALLLLTATTFVVTGCEKKSEYTSHAVAGLQLDLPATPRSLSLTLPPAARAFLTDHETHQALHDGVEITVSRAVYKDTTTVSLDGAVQGSLREMKAAPEVTDFASTVSISTVGGLDARHARGTYRHGGSSRAVEGLYFAREKTAWFVILDGPRDKVAEVAKRVFDSVVPMAQ